MKTEKERRFSPAVTAIVIFGFISMLGDMVYESARSANSQYLSLIGISAARVGLVFGIGEFLGYFLRLIAGIISDRSGRQWLFMFAGYGMLLVVPLMGLTRNWNILVILILAERIGKSLRSPAKDTILSAVAENQVGLGFAFGLQEALDQVGAFAGPLVFTLVFALSGSDGVPQYQRGYRLLVVPFVVLMFFLAYARRKITRERLVPEAKSRESPPEHLRPLFWLYVAFAFFGTLGFVNFSVVGYHLKAKNLMSDAGITLLYSVAMIVDAVAAMLVGGAYDRLKKKTGASSGGLLVLMGIPVLTVALPFLTLARSPALVTAGMVLFGVIMGTHETVMRSAIADITPFHKRGTSYGVFNTAYGLALLCGSALMGWLYDLDKVWIIAVFTCAAEAVALVLYFRMRGLVRESPAPRAGERETPRTQNDAQGGGS